MIATHDFIHPLFDRGKRIADRGGETADFEESVIVFRIADAGDLGYIQIEPLGRLAQSGGLVDPAREHHDGALVEDAFETEFLIASRTTFFVWLPGGCGLLRPPEAANHISG